MVWTAIGEPDARERGTSMKTKDLVPKGWLPYLRAIRSAPERQDLLWEIRRRSRGEPALPFGPIQRVLVFCHGNICRSPLAAHLLATGCPELEVRSGGLEAREGDPAQPGAIRVGAEFGADLERHAAHRLTAVDVAWADLIVGMTGRHSASIRACCPAQCGKVRLLGDFLPGPPFALEDPWGQPDDCFRSVFTRIALANRRLVERLRRGHG